MTENHPAASLADATSRPSRTDDSMEVDIPGEDQSSQSDTESVSSEELAIENPCQDIRGELEKILQGDVAKAFKGSYSFHRSHPNAPNPGLFLLPNDIGGVGLPLSKRDAEAVKSGCRQAPFGKGERTVVDTTVRDTWEMDANQVQFRNPLWKSFVQGIVTNVCTELGVNVAVSQPRCELYKLLLYETGSHFLPHVDTEKANGMFATIVIVLPSKFTGGAAHLSHGMLSTVYDTASVSELQTTALAWYTDVMHEIKPITSGYRLALSYNLLHTANALRPSLPDNDAAVNALRHILLSWKQANPDCAPRKIVYLLDHKYSQANLKGSALKGADAHKLAILDALAKQLGFRLGMASLECHLSGCADDDMGCSYGRRRRWGYYDDYGDSEGGMDSDDVGFGEVEDRDVSITNLVTLDGDELQEDPLDFDEELDPTIPQDLMEKVEAGPHDEQDYEGYMGNGAGSLERWYRRTVLVIWPQGFSMDMTFEDDISEAIEELTHVDPGKPHKRERKLVDFLLRVAAARPENRAEIAETLSDAACTWKDTAMFERIITTCAASAGVRLMGNVVIFRCVEEFGFELLHPILKKMLQTERINFERFQFLDELQNWSSARVNAPDAGNVNSWIIEQRQYFIEHLEKPGPNDSQILVDLSLRYGGYHVLNDTFIPQLKLVADTTFLVSMVIVLQNEKIKPGVSTQDQALLSGAVTDLLSHAIAKVDFFTPAPPRNAMSTQMAMRLVELALVTRNDALVGNALQRLTDMTNVAPAVVQSRVREVLLPMVPLIDAKLKTRPVDMPPVPGVQDFYEATVRLFSGSILSGVGPNKSDLTMLMDVCGIHGGVDVLSKQVWPALKTSKFQANVYTDFTEQLQKHKAQLHPSNTGVSVDSIITDAVRRAIQQTPFAQYIALPYGYPWARGNGTHENRSKTLELLRLCLTTGNRASTSLVFRRLLDPSFHKPEYIENVLVPFLPQLRQFLINNRVSLAEEPFSAVFKSIIMLWASKVLGPKPNQATDTLIAKMRGHPCKCLYCTQAFNFLTTSVEKTCRLERIGAPKRKHLEQELSRNAHGAATWVMIYGSPQGLTITKTDTIYQPVKWKVTHARGSNILKTVSADQKELQTIFGADYQAIMDMLAGRIPAVPSSRMPSLSVNAGTPSNATAVASTSTASAAASTGASMAITASSLGVGSSTPDAAPHAGATSLVSRKRKRVANSSDVIDLTSD